MFRLLNIPTQISEGKWWSLAILPKNIIGEYISPKDIHKAIIENGLALRYTPNHYITKELCYMAIQNNYLAIQYVPSKFIDKNLIDFTIEQILLKNKNPEILLKLDIIPHNLRTKERILKLLNNSYDFELLEKVPTKSFTIELISTMLENTRKIPKISIVTQIEILRRCPKNIILQLDLFKFYETIKMNKNWAIETIQKLNILPKEKERELLEFIKPQKRGKRKKTIEIEDDFLQSDIEDNNYFEEKQEEKQEESNFSIQDIDFSNDFRSNLDFTQTLENYNNSLNKLK